MVAGSDALDLVFAFLLLSSVLSSQTSSINLLSFRVSLIWLLWRARPQISGSHLWPDYPIYHIGPPSAPQIPSSVAHESAPDSRARLFQPPPHGYHHCRRASTLANPTPQYSPAQVHETSRPDISPSGPPAKVNTPDNRACRVLGMVPLVERTHGRANATQGAGNIL